MPIPPEHCGRYVYHFTHIDNLPGILVNGLLSPNEQKRLGIKHKSIAAQGIQDRRAKMKVTCGPAGVVHDYVPFYFCALSKMLLAVVNAKNVDQMCLIYLAIPIGIIERDDVVFTNAAANTEAPPPFFANPSDLCNLTWPLVDSKKWTLSNELEDRQRMAEVLIHERVTIDEVDHIIVWNEAMKEEVKKIFAAAGISPPSLQFQGYNGKYHYFTAFYRKSKKSIVTGPHCTKLAYQDAVKYITDTGQNPQARFENIAELLHALRKDLGCISETAELVGLESANVLHDEDVGAHTQSVVRELRDSAEFAALSENDKLLTEVAAYLHDIGKGPKSKWIDCGGKQGVDPDHPIESVNMLRRILTQEIRTIKSRSIRIIAKLVCYHDLVGDILGRHRNPEQLEEIAESERELDMLIALGLADMKAVNQTWHVRHRAGIAALRDRVLAKINGAKPNDED